jgi:hypothetical protein
LVLLGGWGHIALAADVVKPETPLSVPTVAATPIPGGSGIQNSQDFELEKLRLEKQKLELEVEKMRLQTGANAQSAAPPKREKSYDKNLRKIEQEECVGRVSSSRRPSPSNIKTKRTCWWLISPTDRSGTKVFLTALMKGDAAETRVEVQTTVVPGMWVGTLGTVPIPKRLDPPL